LVADEAIEDSGKIPETAPKGDVADHIKIYIFIVRLLQAFGTFHGAFPCFHSNPNATRNARLSGEFADRRWQREGDANTDSPFLRSSACFCLSP
jgi:hypothetical protein